MRDLLSNDSVVAALLLLGVGYYVSLLLHPYTRCRACRGTGRHTGAIFGYARRPCHACSGRGRQQRFGAVVIGRGERTTSSSRVQPPTRKFGS